MSRVPSFSFWIISLSLPNWLDPNVTTLALPASFAFARFANSSAETWNSEPGSPTWPSLISSCALAGDMTPDGKGTERDGGECTPEAAART